ncbi:MAG: hypothetical protein DRJ97_04050 [Thermoprotei archaeon]|nr:MAG: hypothetical protein DRJ97_04050 [Thermoprotei archaeon]
MPVCPECGGELKFDRSRYMYVCRGCGLSLTRSEFERMSSSRRRAASKAEDEREQLRRDYLRWWLSDKK